MTSNADASPVWFITGCSTGLGRALAKKVLRRGFRAVLTARDIASLTPIVSGFPNTSLPIALDVNNAQDAAKAVKKAEETFGRIDVLVNNAGYGYFAAIEEGEDAEIRAMFDTNFFAVANLIRCVLPGMRARKKGHIINISSVAGMLSNPGSGYYSASKFAVNGMSEGLAKEVAEYGIDVTLIEPGPFRTDFHGRSSRITKTPIAAYAGTAGLRRTQMNANSGKQPGDPERGADVIIKVAEEANPPLHLVFGEQALARVREQMASVQKCLDSGQALSVSVDFPKA